jgi:hypothetical protein
MSVNTTVLRVDMSFLPSFSQALRRIWPHGDPQVMHVNLHFRAPCQQLSTFNTQFCPQGEAAPPEQPRGVAVAATRIHGDGEWISAPRVPEKAWKNTSALSETATQLWRFT